MNHHPSTLTHQNRANTLQSMRKWLNLVITLMSIAFGALLLRIVLFAYAAFQGYIALDPQSFDMQQWQTDLATLWQDSVIVQFIFLTAVMFYCLASNLTQWYKRKAATS